MSMESALIPLNNNPLYKCETCEDLQSGHVFIELNPLIMRNPSCMYCRLLLAVAISNIPNWREADLINLTFDQMPPSSGTILLECNCPKPKKDNLPSRVLRISQHEEGLISLVEGQGLTSFYAILSYVWGDSLPLKLERANIVDRRRGISHAQLPQVFRDAVRVCRKLHIAYLWIDSLCIIQDDEEDWNTESTKMAGYFENALVTISAASSVNSSTPFLCRRQRKWKPHRWFGKKENDTRLNIFVRRYASSAPTGRKSDVTPSTLRAWIFQEMLLSTRVLHYNSSDLVWECRSAIYAEDGAVPWEDCFQRSLTRLQPSSTTSITLELWLELVETYMARKLTFPSDRLPALSGIALRLDNAQGGRLGRYMAGIWEHNLLCELCWGPLPENKQLQPAPRQYLAPSWAWPSLNLPIEFFPGIVRYSHTPFAHLACVVEASCTIATQNPYGTVSDGYLILRGRVAHRLVDTSGRALKSPMRLHKDSMPAEWIRWDCMVTGNDHIAKRTLSTLDFDPFNLRLPFILIGKRRFYYALVLGEIDGEERHRIGIAILETDAMFQSAPEMTLKIV